MRRKIAAILIAVFVVAGMSMFCGCVEESSLMKDPQFEEYVTTETAYPGEVICRMKIPMSLRYTASVQYMGIDGGNNIIFKDLWRGQTYSFQYVPEMTCVVGNERLSNITVDDKIVVSYDRIITKRVK